MTAKRGRPPVIKDVEYINKKIGNIEHLEDSITSMLNEINTMPSDMMAPKNFLPGLDFEHIQYDYEKDIELIKEDAKETLDCISSLYLNENYIFKKNVVSIIKNDAEIISDIKFSLSCAKRGLINCMKKLDAGSEDPEMHLSVNAYQKEIRDSSKMIYDLLTKMKTFYKDLRDEYERKEINEQSKLEEMNQNQHITKGSDGEDMIIFDPKRWNQIIDDMKNDPTLLGGKTFGTNGITKK